MKDLLLALLHLAVMTARLCGPGGVRGVMVMAALAWTLKVWFALRLATTGR